MRLDNIRGRLSGSQTDTGFGTALGSGSRMLTRDGKFNVERVGGPFNGLNMYQWLITISWLKFWGVVFVFYATFNLFFAALYLITGAEINGIEPTQSMWEHVTHAFFFSTQTFTTVGYGYLNPRGLLTNAIASVEAMVGLLAFALATGLVYGRFSRPSACIDFSRNALVAPYKDSHYKALMFRTVNQRSNKLIELEVQVTLGMLRYENNASLRDFFTLALQTNKVYLFPLNWTIVHLIDETSPLYGKTASDIAAADAEIIITIKCFDDTFSQTIYIHNSYKWQEWVWDARFKPMYEAVADTGKTRLYLDKIHDYEMV